MTQIVLTKEDLDIWTFVGLHNGFALNEILEANSVNLDHEDFTLMVYLLRVYAQIGPWTEPTVQQRALWRSACGYQGCVFGP